MNLAWAISGAGHYLKESVNVMEELAKKHKITTFLSKSGEEVIRAYGLWNALKRISPGGYLQEIFTYDKQGSSAPSTGRFFLKKYELLIVSPATTNTIAKIVSGISDTLVTNAVSHAMKSLTPVYICPVDIIEKEVETALPYYIDKEACIRCSPCEPANACSKGAIANYSIALLKCDACGECESLCEYTAILGKKKVKMKVRKIDVENVEKMKRMELATVLKNPREILRINLLH